MKTIVAAVDFSDASQGVIQMASDMANAFGARLHLLHVVEPEPSYTAYGLTPDEFPALQNYQDEAKRRAEKKLSTLLAEVRQNVSGAMAHLAEGSPIHELLDYVKAKEADFVIIGSHGHGVIAALLLGSVAEGMARRSVVPTLIVPAKP